METSVELNDEQQKALKELLGVGDLKHVKVTFEVPSENTNKMLGESVMKASSLVIKMCYCGGGRFSPACC